MDIRNSITERRNTLEAWNVDHSYHQLLSGFEEDCKLNDAFARQQRMRGIMIGLGLAAVAMFAGLMAAYLLDKHWPIACDGTTSAITCGLRAIGGSL